MCQYSAREGRSVAIAEVRISRINAYLIWLLAGEAKFWGITWRIVLSFVLYSFMTFITFTVSCLEPFWRGGGEGRGGKHKTLL